MRKVWLAVAFILGLWTIVLAVINCYQTWSLYPLMTLVLMGVLLFLLFIVEGTEISVVALLDKDPEQVGHEPVRKVLTTLQADPNVFLTGRQLMAVGLIVAFTLLSESLSSVKQVSFQWWLLDLILEAATSPKGSAVYSFALPTFFLLWFAQLLPKFLVHEKPLGFFSTPVPQWLIKGCIWLEKSQVGVISQRVRPLLENLTVFSGGPLLLPSRLTHYRDSATLRYGKGLEEAEVRLLIGKDGKVLFSSSIVWKAFNAGVKDFTERHHFGASLVRNSCKIERPECPPECGDVIIKGPEFSNAKIGGEEIQDGSVTWTIETQADLLIGKEFKYKVSFDTCPDAMRTQRDEKDWYEWTVKTPTAKLSVTVLPDEACGFSLSGGKCVADVVTPAESRENFEEAKRVEVKPVSRGYRYFIPFPLPGSTYTFQWTVSLPLA